MKGPLPLPVPLPTGYACYPYPYPYLPLPFNTHGPTYPYPLTPTLFHGTGTVPWVGIAGRDRVPMELWEDALLDRARTPWEGPEAFRRLKGLSLSFVGLVSRKHGLKPSQRLRVGSEVKPAFCIEKGEDPSEHSSLFPTPQGG